MDRRQAGSVPLHIALLEDPDRMLALYDQSAQDLIDTVRPEGYFEGWDAGDLTWPPSRTGDGPIDLQGLRKRVRLVDTIFGGVPPLRDERLSEAHSQFRRLSAAYHEGNRIYLQLGEQFVRRRVGTEQDFLQLYQTLYVEALAKGDLFSPDVGEASLERAGITRTPLSHAQAVAEALSSVVLADDPRWEMVFSTRVDGAEFEASLRDLLQGVAQRTLDYIAAGELLATRFNTYSNFGLFGSSVWKVIVDADLLLHRLEAASRVEAENLVALRSDVLRAVGMLIEFFRAHREDPAKLKPDDYWYGQDYSYLTRDMIDLTVQLVDCANRLARKAGGIEGEAGMDGLALPPLLAGRAAGRFLEYAHAGRKADISPLRRGLRFSRWVMASVKLGRRKKRLAREALETGRRRELAWQACLEWAEASLRIFDIRVDVRIDPRFFPISRELELGSGRRKVLFLPAHQSLLDHVVMYHLLQAPELLEAMGWQAPAPCVILARTGLARAGVRIGSWAITQFGISSETFDRLMEEVDGYVMLERSGATGPTTPRVVEALEGRPGLIYPMATTSAFDAQVFPFQHALFAYIPQDVVIIPVAFRGIHSLWPKCPKGNVHINPGLVEAVVSPPMLGETTLLPRRRSLRIQLEASALFQAVHIATLFNPEPSEG